MGEIMEAKEFSLIDCKPSKSHQAAKLHLVDGLTLRKAAQLADVSIQALQKWKKTHIKGE